MIIQVVTILVMADLQHQSRKVLLWCSNICRFDGAGVRVMHAHFRVNGTSVAQTDMFGGASNHGGSMYHQQQLGICLGN